MAKYKSMMGSIPTVPKTGQWNLQGSQELPLRALAKAVLERELDDLNVPHGALGGQQLATPSVTGSTKVVIAGVKTAASVAVHEQLVKGLAVYQIQVLPLKEAPIGVADPWFEACQEASACVALLSNEFLDSERCEDQVTFAKDTRTRTVAVVIDEEAVSMGSQDGAEGDAGRIRELEAEVTRLQQLLSEK